MNASQFKTGCLVLCVLCAAWFIPLSTADGQQPGQADAKKRVDADEAIRAVGNQRWYDKESDSYAPPKTSESLDNPLRTDGWMAKSRNKTEETAAETSSWGSWWSGTLTPFSANFFSSIVLILLAIALVAMIALLTYHSIRNYIPGRWEKSARRKKIEIDPAKVADLPFEIEQTSHSNPLSEAEALMQAGKYDQAIVFLYGYMLLALDQSRKIDLQKGKTNRMYLRELNRHASLRSIVEQAMLAFEDVFFGKHAVGEDRFVAVWDQLDTFHQLATSTSAATISPSVSEVSPA